MTLTPDSLKFDSPIPTLGRIPLLNIRLGRRLFKRGLVGNPRFMAYKPSPKVLRPESES